MQGVALGWVTVAGDEVYADVYGGPDRVCASVAFTFADEAERRHNVDRLHRWQQDATPLSLVVHGDTVRLVSEAALFSRALETTAWA